MIWGDAQTVYQAFARTAARVPERAMLNVMSGTADVYGIAAGEITYGAAAAQVDALAEAFARANFGAGHRVALLLENRPEYFLIWLALNKLGASVVPINPDLRAGELAYLIGHAEPDLIIAIPSRHAELRSAASVSDVKMPVIAPDGAPPSLSSGAAEGRAEDGAAREAAILYTSGTTGNPKGCVLSNLYFLMAGDWYANVGGIATLQDGARMITPLPVFHMNAMAYSFMAMLAVGGCLTVLDRFHPSTWWQDVADSGATCLHYLGVMPSMLLGLPESRLETAHCVRFGFGAGVDPSKQAAFEARFGFPLCEAWAMTETGAGAVIAASTPDRLVGQATLGRPAADLDWKIVGEDGEDASQGELLVRRKSGRPRDGFFTHYHKDPEATEAAWAGGWFHTGDIVRQDPNANLFFVDRRKNVIRRSGENIAAVEVESLLMRHPAVRAAGVAAIPDEMRGDEVFACLVADASAEEIARWALEEMAYYKVPGYIAFVDALPLTATQKIQRKALKDLAIQLLNHAATADLRHLKKRQLA